MDYNTSSRLRLAQGDVRDEIRETLYDSIDIANGESPVAIRRFFQTVTGKNLAQTNLRLNGTLESSVSFKVMGLAIDAQNLYSANKLGLGLIMEHSSIKLRIGEKDYWSGPMLFVAGRVWHHSARAGAADAETVYQHFGDVAVAPVVLAGKHAVEINQQQNFQVEWVCDGMSAAEIASSTPAAGAGTKQRYVFSLKGLKRRPVQ